MFSYDANEMFDLFRGTCSSSMSILAMVSLIPLLLLVSSSPMVVIATNQFTIYRMQQYDTPNGQHGSRNSLMNLEARTIHNMKDSLLRKCVLVKLKDLMESMDTFEQLIEDTVASGILILLPSTLITLKAKEIERLNQIETFLLNRDIFMPIYFAHEDQELISVYHNEMQRSSNKESIEDANVSGMQKLINTFLANGHQMVVSGPQSAPVKEAILINIQAKLSGSVHQDMEDQLPTIVFVAHYDAYGVAPGLSFGSDSNGSGVVALLELIRLFSKLYSNPKTHPKANLLFLLSGGGKFNYIGTKRWIEEHVDNSENSILSDSLFTVCLDSLLDSEGNKGLFMHVSKPPKEGTPFSSFFNHMKDVSSQLYGSALNVSMIHKKINLADESLAWEHERFSIRRLPAFTLSSLTSHKSLVRKSITDVHKANNKDYNKSLISNIRIIAEATSRLIFNVNQSDLFDSELHLSKSFIASTLTHVSSQPRAQQLLLSTQKGSRYEHAPLVTSLEYLLSKMVKDVHLYPVKISKNEPEVVFYEPTIVTLDIYNVKPAIFDLVLSIVIAAYFGLLFLLLINLDNIFFLVRKLKFQENQENGKVKFQ